MSTKRQRSSSSSKPGNSRLLARTAALHRICDETQELLNNGYKVCMAEHAFRFAKGDPIIALDAGYYHQGSIVNYYRATVVPDTYITPGKTCKTLPISEWIPTVLIRLYNADEKDVIEVPENELILRVGVLPCDVQGMLMAHQWNELYRERFQMTEMEMGEDAWFLENDDYANLEITWRNMFNQKESFVEYCSQSQLEKTSPSVLSEFDETSPSSSSVTINHKGIKRKFDADSSHSVSMTNVIKECFTPAKMSQGNPVNLLKKTPLKGILKSK